MDPQLQNKGEYGTPMPPFNYNDQKLSLDYFLNFKTTKKKSTNSNKFKNKYQLSAYFCKLQ